MRLEDQSDAELLQLIAAATAELQRRQQPEVVRVKHQPVVVTVHEPDDDDKDFALRIKSVMLSGGYVKASERARIAQIAEKFPVWVTRQRLPTVSGTGDWRKARSYYSTPVAKER